jgi:hypothetical protein
MLDLKRKATDGSKTLRVQGLSATTGVKVLKNSNRGVDRAVELALKVG